MRLSIAVILAIIFIGCGDSNKGAAADPKNNVMSANETKVFKILMEEDFISWVNNEPDSTIAKVLDLPIMVMADEYQREYDKNEVAADQKFKDKLLIFKGVVKSIDRSIGENYSVSFHGGENPFISPQAMMADGYTDYLAKLEKEDKQALSCVGSGKIIGFAQVKECIPFGKWVKQNIDTTIEQANTIDLKNTELGNYIAVVKVITDKLPKNSACFAENVNTDTCFDDIRKIPIK